MSESLTIATANTYVGKLLLDSNGLDPFAELGVDALLMQEVIGLSEDRVNQSLEQSGYRLACFDDEAGLAIALRNDGQFKTRPTESDNYTVQPIGLIGQLAMKHGLPGAHRLRPRKLLSADTVTEEEQKVRLWTAHPIVFARLIARRRQVGSIANIIASQSQDCMPTIFAADMNHYPSPRNVDKKLAEAAGLQHVLIDGSTWKIEGSKHEWIAKLGSLVTGKPISDFDAQLDSMWYSGMELVDTAIIDISSDHRAIIGKFSI